MAPGQMRKSSSITITCWQDWQDAGTGAQCEPGAAAVAGMRGTCLLHGEERRYGVPRLLPHLYLWRQVGDELIVRRPVQSPLHVRSGGKWAVRARGAAGGRTGQGRIGSARCWQSGGRVPAPAPRSGAGEMRRARARPGAGLRPRRGPVRAKTWPLERARPAAPTWGRCAHFVAVSVELIRDLLHQPADGALEVAHVAFPRHGLHDSAEPGRGAAPRLHRHHLVLRPGEFKAPARQIAPVAPPLLAALPLEVLRPLLLLLPRQLQQRPLRVGRCRIQGDRHPEEEGDRPHLPGGGEEGG